MNRIREIYYGFKLRMIERKIERFRGEEASMYPLSYRDSKPFLDEFYGIKNKLEKLFEEKRSLTEKLGVA